MSNRRVTEIKLVVVGDAGVGKTCLLFTYFDGAFPEEYVPTVYEISWKEVEVDGQQCLLKPWDTGGTSGLLYNTILQRNYTNCLIIPIIVSIYRSR